jgi:hypothetical protein
VFFASIRPAALDWWNYIGASSARAFISPSTIEPTDDIPGVGDGVTNQATFLARRSALRAAERLNLAMVSDAYIAWAAFKAQFAACCPGSSNTFDMTYMFSSFAATNVTVLVQVFSASLNWLSKSQVGTWPGNWELWQNLYAQAFYYARTYGFAQWSFTNEPDLDSRTTAADILAQHLIASDAVQCAIADVNAAAGSRLVPWIYAPVLAGYSGYYRGNISDPLVGPYSGYGQLLVQNLNVQVDNTTNTSYRCTFGIVS